MSTSLTADEDLAHRLPLPLAQLYRRALNAKTPHDRHHHAYCLAEAALKLSASLRIGKEARSVPSQQRLPMNPVSGWNLVSNGGEKTNVAHRAASEGSSCADCCAGGLLRLLRQKQERKASGDKPVRIVAGR